MKSNEHKILLNLDQAPFVLKGLVSSSIHEPPVPLRLNGKAKGRFHGVEIFERVAGSFGYPQTIADIVSNTYFRLSYPKRDGRSATFGTSLVGTVSVRTADGSLLFIPQVEEAVVDAGNSHRLSVFLSGKFGDAARMASTRIYATDASCCELKMQVRVSFTALRDLPTVSRLRGVDSCRLLTISSMFLNSQRYDGNQILWTGEQGEGVRRLNDDEGRGIYLFDRQQRCSHFELRKTKGSTGAFNTPGSPDSPSVRVSLLDSSLPKSELGVQAYLANSTDMNDDSLSVWLEWLDCPATIEEGRQISATFEVSALPPN